MNFWSVLSTTLLLVISKPGHSDLLEEKIAGLSKEPTLYMVAFYYETCSACDAIFKIWKQWMSSFEDSTLASGTLTMDCAQNKKTCEELGITTYPSVKLLTNSQADEKVSDSNISKMTDPFAFYDYMHKQLGLSQKPAEVRTVDREIIEFNENTFEKAIAVGKHFVMFYSSPCELCEIMQSHLKLLAQELDQLIIPEQDETIKINIYTINDPIIVSKVDCFQFPSICEPFKIKEFPHFMWIHDGRDMEVYTDEKTHVKMLQYLIKKSRGETDGIRGKNSEDVPVDIITPEELSDKTESRKQYVQLLSGANFNDEIRDGVTFVKFFAPWCGHCKRLAPTWDELGRKYVHRHNVSIAKVDCTMSESKNLCNKQQVEGFPTMFLYKNGKKIKEYSGKRTLEDLYNFVEDFVGGPILHDEF